MRCKRWRSLILIIHPLLTSPHYRLFSLSQPRSLISLCLPHFLYHIITLPLVPIPSLYPSLSYLSVFLHLYTLSISLLFHVICRSIFLSGGMSACLSPVGLHLFLFLFFFLFSLFSFSSFSFSFSSFSYFSFSSLSFSLWPTSLLSPIVFCWYFEHVMLVKNVFFSTLFVRSFQGGISNFVFSD